MAAKWKDPARDALDTLVFGSADLPSLDKVEQVTIIIIRLAAQAEFGGRSFSFFPVGGLTGWLACVWQFDHVRESFLSFGTDGLHAL
jgi:hypothetical protein